MASPEIGKAGGVVVVVFFTTGDVPQLRNWLHWKDKLHGPVRALLVAMDSHALQICEELKDPLLWCHNLLWDGEWVDCNSVPNRVLTNVGGECPPSLLRPPASM